MVLNLGYISEMINGIMITKNMQEVYSELLNKYESKNDWGCSGYYAYHQKYADFNVIDGIYVGANNDVRTSLYNLRGWIIRYFAYKVCKDKWNAKVEELFLNDNSNIKDEQKLCNMMINLDGKIIESISKYKD